MRYFGLFATLLVISCTKKPVCVPAIAAAKLISVSTSTILDCTEIDAIETDVLSYLKIKTECSGTQNGMQATGISFVCEPASIYVATQVKDAIPPRWGCKGGLGITFLQTGTYQACMAILPMSQK